MPEAARRATLSASHTFSSSIKRLPLYAVVGLLTMVISEIAMFARVEPFWSWHTAIAWTGYICFIDGIVWVRRGSSWLKSAPHEFVFLALASIPLWLVFEFYNLFIRNWHYINLPENLVLRLFGYGWSFATIWPAIFETGELFASLGTSKLPARAAHRPTRLSMLEWALVAAGAIMLVWPLMRPSAYLAAPVWLGFIFLLDPINARLGGEALVSDLRRRRYDRLLNLILAGFLCGILWEFWNYWARAKWVYSVPIMPRPRLFEMPLAGYLGFPAFALECFAMYVTVRLLLWRGPCRPISL